MAADARIEVSVLATDPEPPVVAWLVWSRDEAGEPVPCARIGAEIDGHGSLEAHQLVTRSTLSTGEQGDALVAWWPFPVYRPRRELHGVIMLDCADSRVAQLHVEPGPALVGTTIREES